MNQIYSIHMNHKRVRRLISELGIKAIIRRKRPYYAKKEP
ncbi:IS3 family transposase [Paenibacillus sp. Lou8.1]